jgi:ribose-phosphate pyrophosphokinase
MKLMVFAGSANLALAQTVAQRLEVPLGGYALHHFPDGELQIEIHDSVRGRDVYLVQSTSPPVQEQLLELLFLADACRRAGAAQLTAVMPYFAYARQDRRAAGREAVGARLIADLLRVSGLQRIVALDLHTPALEGFFSMPLEHLTAVPLLAEAVRSEITTNHVIVAPDLGAVKLAERYARQLQLPLAVVQKVRLSGDEVKAVRVMGEVQGHPALIVDDMMSTGGTIEAAIKALLAADCRPDFTVATSHALFVGCAAERLRTQPVRRYVVTDSVTGTQGRMLPVELVSLAPLLADAIQRLHQDQSLSDLIARG